MINSSLNRAVAIAILAGASVGANATTTNLGTISPSASTGFAGTSQLLPPEPWLREPCSTSVRIYPAAEQSHLGAECLGFISFLESAGVLPASMREVVIERAMAAPGAPVSLDDLKIIILMVYWSFGQEPDALVLDELCDDNSDRVAH